MKILENMDLCYGCAACANICPKAAISMKPAKDGFLYPVIDQDACINCGACQRVCPQLTVTYENDREPKVHAVMANDDIREKSASGGVFSLLAEYAFEQDGYVVGAAFADDFRSVHHEMIHDRKDLDRLRRSKYVQSESGDIYKQIKEKLDQDSFVLFVGTPCQCAALKSFLRKPYEKLLVVDLICHGTPSPLAWNKFLDEIAQDKPIRDVNFRYKDLIGWSSTTYVEYGQGEKYIETSKKCIFEQAFQRNMISRKSCGQCQFARIPRQGDMTIGDFWGAEKFDKELNDKKGTSIILVNTPKGADAYERMVSRSEVIKHAPVPFYTAFARRNANVYRFPPTDPGRQLFFDGLAGNKKFSAALADGKTKKFDIMLLGIWYGGNYGSMMTNFALYKFLEDMGYNCIFGDIPDHIWTPSRLNRDPLSVMRRFGQKHFKLTGKYKNKIDHRKANDRADTFIVGSDQLWNNNLCKPATTHFYLDFVNDDKKKIAYGTSFGHTQLKGSEEDIRTAGFYLNRFDAISVREDYAVDMCKNIYGLDAVQVLDPVFMVDKKHYLNCIAESNLVKNPPEKKYVLAYILDPNEAKQAAAENMAKELKAELICIPNARLKGNMRQNWRLPILEDIDMEDWLYYFQNAEMVITDSFHGTCFSVIFEKPFVAIGNKGRGLERFYSLLKDFDLMDRLVLTPKEITEKNLIHTCNIDYAKVNAKIAALREESTAWLVNALNKPAHPKSYSAYDVVERHIGESVDQFKEVYEADNKKTAQTIRDLEAKVAALDKKIRDMQKNGAPVQQKHQEYIVLEEEALKLNNQIKNVKEQMEGYQRKIAYMENSISWKITKPLRMFIKLIKREK